MKKVKYMLAVIAVITAAATMSFTMVNSKAKTKVQQNEDCWSSTQRYEDGEAPNVNQEDQCDGLGVFCCVKPNPSSPTGYDIFERDEL